MANIAIIPARSGSKGLKDKNIKLLMGKPMMAHTIMAAIDSNVFDEVMVSTDSSEYAEIAKQYGAKVPFLRSRVNSGDSASSWDMVDEVLFEYQKKGKTFDTFCLLQPTSPLRNAQHIIEAYELYDARAEVAVISVREVEHSPLWVGKLGNDGSLDVFIPPENMVNRQTSENYYRINGAIYIVNTKQFISKQYLYRTGSYAYVMDQFHSVDIDTSLDFKIAEIIMQ